MSVDLTTRYLGFTLKNPLVVSACPLSGKLTTLRMLEETGVSAAVLPSLFEEQIVHDDAELARVYERGADSFAEALTYFPEPGEYRTGPAAYLEHIEKAKKVVSIPIIASLNGQSKGGWVEYAKKMQNAGADAIELNIYFVAADLDMSGRDVESRYLDLVAAVKGSVSIPVAVKIGPYFSSIPNMAQRLAEAGADGLVLFNRFYQPDIDLDNLEAVPKMVLSTSHELSLPLRWIGILHGRISVSLAATSGIHTAADMLKALLVGADVGMIASVLYQGGTKKCAEILAGLARWMEENDYESVEQLKGSMSQENCPDPSAFVRGNYMKALTSFTGEFI